jgi:hypothetical protein
LLSIQQRRSLATAKSAALVNFTIKFIHVGFEKVLIAATDFKNMTSSGV